MQLYLFNNNQEKKTTFLQGKAQGHEMVCLKELRPGSYPALVCLQ